MIYIYRNILDRPNQLKLTYQVYDMGHEIQINYEIQFSNNTILKDIILKNQLKKK